MSDNNRQIAHGHEAGVQIKLIKRAYVFPWSQFLFAEGGADEIRMAFSTHDVVISGRKLDTLLEEIAKQYVKLLKEPVRAESFAAFPDLQITGISIKKAE